MPQQGMQNFGTYLTEGDQAILRDTLLRHASLETEMMQLEIDQQKSRMSAEKAKQSAIAEALEALKPQWRSSTGEPADVGQFGVGGPESMKWGGITRGGGFSSKGSFDIQGPSPEQSRTGSQVLRTMLGLPAVDPIEQQEFGLKKQREHALEISALEDKKEIGRETRQRKAETEREARQTQKESATETRRLAEKRVDAMRSAQTQFQKDLMDITKSQAVLLRPELAPILQQAARQFYNKRVRSIESGDYEMPEDQPSEEEQSVRDRLKALPLETRKRVAKKAGINLKELGLDK